MRRTRIRRLRGAALVAFAVAVTGGGIVVTNQSGVAGTANLWVQSGAGTCTRSATPVSFDNSASPDARCGTFDQAYDAAVCSDAVLVKGGSYGAQTITGAKSCSGWTVGATSGVTCTGCVFFDEAAGEAVTLTGAITTTAQWLRVKGLLITAGGWAIDGAGINNVLMEDVTMDGATAHVGRFDLSSTATDLAWVGGEMKNTETNGSEPMYLINADEFTIEGIWFHDNIRNPVGDHMEVIRIDGGSNGYRIRYNKFENNQDNTSAIFWTNAQESGGLADPFGLTIENNFISAENLAIKNQTPTIGVCTDITIRYNTLKSGLVYDECTASNVVTTGNIGPKGTTACIGTYIKNVWQHNVNTACGTDTWVNGPAFSTSALGLDTDGFHLTATSVARGAGGTGTDCTTRDYDGDLRPIPAGGNCDAGGDERD